MCMCMCICTMCMCIFICIFICICIFIYVYLYMYIYIYMYMYIYICIFIFICICVRIFICIQMLRFFRPSGISEERRYFLLRERPSVSGCVGGIVRIGVRVVVTLYCKHDITIFRSKCFTILDSVTIAFGLHTGVQACC